MNKFTEKVLLTFVLVCLSSYASASKEKCEKPTKLCCQKPLKIDAPCDYAYNAPARKDPACGWDAYISTNFFCWQIIEKGMDVGQYYIEKKSVPLSYDLNIIKIDSSFHPGFKFGAGFSSEKDDWTFLVEYNRLCTKEKGSLNLKNSVSDKNHLTTPWIKPSLKTEAIAIIGDSKYSSLRTSFKTKLNIIDTELGRPFYLGKKLILKPHCGLRGGTIDQKYNLTAKLMNTSDKSKFVDLCASNKSNSWLIGPRAGVDTNWMVGHGLKIISNVSASLFYQKFITSIEQALSEQPLVSFEKSKKILFKHSQIVVNSSLELDLGIGWGSYIKNNEWFLDISLSYAYQYLWNQNMIRTLSDNLISDLDGNIGNLMSHGIVVTAKIDF